MIATMLVGWPIASAVANRLVLRFGFRPPVWIGSLFIAAGLGAHFVGVTGDHGLGLVRVAMFLFGAGMGLTVTAQLLAIQVGAAHHERGVATATGLFARSMGGALGAGALGAVLAAGLGHTLDAETVSRLLDPHQRAELLDPTVATSLGGALSPIWTVLVVLAVANLLIVAFYPAGSREEVPASAPVPAGE